MSINRIRLEFEKIFGTYPMAKKKPGAKRKTPLPKMGRPELGELKRDIVLAQIVVNQHEADIIRQRAAAAGLPVATFLRMLGTGELSSLL
jgi:hypothetical protein